MPTFKMTADTITTAQIRALRQEALAAGGYDQELLCSIALAAHETADAEGGDLIGPDGKPTTRTAAREACAEAIAAAQAQA